jgi:simple sugar transport system permease protein
MPYTYPMSLLSIEKRPAPSPGLRLTVTLVSVLLALVFSGLVILAIGVNPVEAYGALLQGAFGNLYGLSETLVKATPLILCSLGVAAALRMKVWNIGAEGQYVAGSLAASLVALNFSSLPASALLPLMGLAGILGGGIWAGLAGVLRAFLSVNEIITTLLMNWIAILLSSYFVYGPLKGADGFPFSQSFCAAACLPDLGWGRLHLGIFIALIAAALLYVALHKTVWGFEVRVIGENEAAARYAGMKIEKNIVLILFLSGALAGMAGFTEAAGIEHRVGRVVASGYGYTAILIAWLARTHPLAVVLVALLFGGLLTGGEMIQISLLVPVSVVPILEGAILFFLLAGEVLVNYRIRIRVKRVTCNV